MGEREGIVLGLAASVVWGLTPVATKLALVGFGPEMIAVVRLAAAALLFAAAAPGATRVALREPWHWLAGLGLGLDVVLYNVGVGWTTAVATSLLVNTGMIFTIGLAAWLLGEPVTRRRALGAMATLAGVGWIALDGVGATDLVARDRLAGNAMIVAAAFAWAVYSVAQRRVAATAPMAARLAAIFSVATIVAVPTLARPGALVVHPSWATAGWLMGLVVVGTVGVYVLYARAQQLIDVTVLSILFCSIPVFSVVFAWALVGERPTPRLLVGGALVMAGVAVITTERSAAP